MASEPIATGFNRFNSTVIKQPRLSDPATLYKAGEEPRRVHRIDVEAWLRQGWSEEPVAEQSEPEQPKLEQPKPQPQRGRPRKTE